MTRPKVFFYSKNLDPNKFGKFGFGGNNRTRQIVELLEEGGFEIKRYAIQGMFSRRERLQALRFLYSNSLWRPKLNLKQLSRLAGDFCAHVRTMRSAGSEGIVITEDPTDFVWHHAVRRAGWHSLVVPNCLESLWPDWSNPITGSTIPQSLDEELRYLGMVDAVFFISREEQWLAANYGVGGRYLPYFPPTDIERRLRIDRAMRSATDQKGCEFLIFGAAVQPNAIEGMRQQARMLVDILGDRNNTTIHVVGAGTEKIRDTWRHPLFRFHGPVDVEELGRIKARVKACLVYATRGHGALTRIPEMLLSGVPVVADGLSCRSAWTYSGLYSFDTASELAEILSMDFGMAPEPAAPLLFEKAFLDVVRGLLPAGKSQPAQ